MVIKPFTAIHFFGKQKLVITTPYGFIGSHFYLVFSIFSSNSVSILSSKSFTKVEGLLKKLSKNGFFKKKCFHDYKLGLDQSFPQDFAPQLAEICYFISPMVPKFKIQLYGFILNILFLTLPFFKLYHVLMDVLIASFHVKLTEKFQ